MRHLLRVIVILLALPLFALNEADREAITNIIHNYTYSWNYLKCQGFGKDFTEDADFINIVGMHFSGNREIEHRHIKILETFLKGSTFKVRDVYMRSIQPDVISAIVHWEVEGFRFPGSDPNTPGSTQEGIFTHLFVKENGLWKISLCQNTLIPQKELE